VILPESDTWWIEKCRKYNVSNVKICALKQWPVFFCVLYFELWFFLHMNLCWCNTRINLSCWMWDRYMVAVRNLCLPYRLIMTTNKPLDLCSELLSKKVDKKHTSPNTFVSSNFLNINNWKLERKENLDVVSDNKRKSAPLYRHWGSVQAVLSEGGAEV
jgi:hypothetical protein